MIEQVEYMDLKRGYYLKQISHFNRVLKLELYTKDHEKIRVYYPNTAEQIQEKKKEWKKLSIRG